MALSVAGSIALPLGLLVAGPAGAATSTTTRDARRLVSALDHAFAAHDVTYLLRHLYPAVIHRYGTGQCRRYLTTLVKRPPVIRASAYGTPGDYAYDSDGVSTVVHGVVPVSATVTVGGRSGAATVHVTRSQWFTDCGSPVGADAAIAVANALAGHYAGAWHNETFGTSGSLVLDLTVDAGAKVLRATVTLGGNVFGGTAPAPETVAVPIDPAHPHGPVIAPSRFFGPITLTEQSDGSIVADAPSVPGGVIAKLHATLAPTATGFGGSYTLTFAGSTRTATGTVEVTRS